MRFLGWFLIWALLCLIVYAAVANTAYAHRNPVIHSIYKVYPAGAQRSNAIRIAGCETGGTFDQWAVGKAGEVSAFQIHPIHWYQTKTFWIKGKKVRKYVTPRNLSRYPIFAARWAFAHSTGGWHWRAWTCQRLTGVPY